MEGRGVALITGAAGGMGRACVQRLSRDGFRIAAMDINAQGLAESVARLETEACAYPLDQTDEKQVWQAVARIEQEMGPIEALVNTTGWTEGTRFDEETVDYWKKVVAINYLAALYVTFPVIKAMIGRQRGNIVYITSDAAKVGTANEAVYAGAKAAECAFAKSIARENARHNININCIAPGPTATPLLRQVQEQNPELIRRMTRLVPFRRMGTPEEQAAVVGFLVSEDAKWITGQVISTSGGLTMC